MTDALVGHARKSSAQKTLVSYAVDWCRTHKVELPAEKTLRRLAGSARKQFFEKLYDEVSSRLDA